MKKFWNGIAIWFLIQLVFASAVGTYKHLSSMQGDYTPEYLADCRKTNPMLGFVAGAALPITSITIFEAGWCWEE